MRVIYMTHLTAVTRDSGLNFPMQKTDLHYLLPGRLWNLTFEVMFSIFKLKKPLKKGQ